MRRRNALQLLLPLPFREREFVAPAYAVIGGAVVPYTIKRSGRRRAISLRIDESGLRVGAPVDASQRAIDKVLQTHGEWIIDKLRVWADRAPQVAQFIDGARLMLRGEPLVLRCVEQAARGVIRDDTLFAPPHHTERHVTAVLQQAALDCFRERVAHYCAALGLPMPEVRLSAARTRWGSCHIGGRILLNWRIIQMPMPLIDYVVAHEVAHLRQMNHSKRFWAVVGTLVPDYEARRKAIRREGHRYLVV